MFSRRRRGAFFHTEVGLPEGYEPPSAALAPPLPAELVERKTMESLYQRLKSVGFDRSEIPLLEAKVQEQVITDSDPRGLGFHREGEPRWVTVDLGQGIEIRIRRPFT